MVTLQGITNEILEKRILEQKRSEKSKDTQTKKSVQSNLSEHTTSSKTTTLFGRSKQKPRKKGDYTLVNQDDTDGESGRSENLKAKTDSEPSKT